MSFSRLWHVFWTDSKALLLLGPRMIGQRSLRLKVMMFLCRHANTIKKQTCTINSCIETIIFEPVAQLKVSQFWMRKGHPSNILRIIFWTLLRSTVDKRSDCAKQQALTSLGSLFQVSEYINKSWRKIASGSHHIVTYYMVLCQSAVSWAHSGQTA